MVFGLRIAVWIGGLTSFGGRLDTGVSLSMSNTYVMTCYMDTLAVAYWHAQEQALSSKAEFLRPCKLILEQ